MIIKVTKDNWAEVELLISEYLGTIVFTCGFIFLDEKVQWADIPNGATFLEKDGLLMVSHWDRPVTLSPVSELKPYLQLRSL